MEPITYKWATNGLREAIDRSISHDESIAITLTAPSIEEVCEWIHHHVEPDYETDYARENDGRWDVWGWTEATPQDQQGWRLLVTLEE